MNPYLRMKLYSTLIIYPKSYCIEVPVLGDSTPVRTLLFGPLATGKTSVMRTILNEISDHTYTS